MEVKTQQQDIGQQLQDAVLRAAMPAEDDASVSDKKPPEKGERPRGNGGVPVPGGRPKGVKNKLTTTIRDAVMQAFDEVGGAQYLVKLANGTQSDRAAFTGLLNKVLPTQINANVEGGVQVQLSWLGARSIGTTTAQIAEPVTQVLDLQKDSAGKYRIIDQVSDATPAAGAGGGSEAGKPPGGAQDA